MKQLTYFSLFSGIGGLDYGLHKLGAKCIGFSEIKKSSIEIFEKRIGHYDKSTCFGDITRINIPKMPDFNMLIGGFPCQSFSIAGMRKGFKDERGKMIFYIHEILEQKKPQFAVLENVKGIINHNKGKTLKDVIKLLSSAGYYVRVVLLNAIHYGTAQNRERVFFLCSRKDFPIKTPQIKDDKKLFRDIRDPNKATWKFLNDTDFNYKKIQQQRKAFNFELIGGYDRVGTLTTQQGCGEKVVYEEEQDNFRFLTPLECERLQGFPDGWTEGISDANRYFGLGNAVSPKVSEYLFTEYLKGLWY